MANENFDFQEQLEHHLSDEQGKHVVVTLLSGDKHQVDARNRMIIYPRLVLVLKSDGNEAFFPFEAICNVDVFYNE